MTIVAIGGGEISEGETLEIEKKIVELTGKENPQALFIPTASRDSQGYIQVFKQVYGEKLGCKTSALKLVEENPSQEKVRKKILSADLIYVGGGNTKLMLKNWEKHNLGKYLKQAEQKGTILSGLSAGAVCWFEKAMTDSEKLEKDNWNYTIEQMLGFIPNTVVCPHYNNPKIREKFQEYTKKTEKRALGIEDCAALIIEDGKYETIKSNPKANTYKIKNGENTKLSEGEF
jgi:dipeptidase E